MPAPDLQQPVRASLPFLSTAAAALVAGELLKLQEGIVPRLSPNAVSADFERLLLDKLGPGEACPHGNLEGVDTAEERRARGWHTLDETPAAQQVTVVPPPVSSVATPMLMEI